MTAGILNPKDDGRATSDRPAHVNTDAGTRKWWSDALRIRPKAQDFNGIIAQLREVMDYYGITDSEGDDTLLRQAIQEATREIVETDRTYYVRPDGNDANDGLADTAGGAFLTIQRAFDVAALIDAGRNAITIKCADGTYTENPSIDSPILASNIDLQGNLTTPGNCIIDGGTGACVYVAATDLVIKGFKLTAIGAGGTGLDIEKGARCLINGKMEFACPFDIYAYDRAAVFISTAGHVVSSGGVDMLWADTKSLIMFLGSATLTFSGSPAFTGALMRASYDSAVLVSNVTFSGTVTGVKYIADGYSHVGYYSPATAHPDRDLPGSIKGYATNSWASATANRNLIVNGDGRLQDGPAGAVADDTYGLHNRWYALSQSGTVTPTQLTDVEDALPQMMRLTNSHGSAQRMGYAQIVEGKRCKHLRGAYATLAGLVRSNVAGAIRVALLEWTGTEDAVTSDIVNNWTSTDYTAGNFFAATNITVVAVGVIVPTTDVPQMIAASGRLSSSFNNLIVFAWTQTTAVAGTGTFDLRLQLEEGGQTKFEERPLEHEQRLAARYYQTKTVRSENGDRHIPLSKMRAAPSVAVGVGSAANITADGFELSHSAAADCTVIAAAEL